VNVPSLETAIMTHAGLAMDAFALDAATVGGDLEEARYLARSLAVVAAGAGLSGIAEAAKSLAVALGSKGATRVGVLDHQLVLLANALDDADPRRAVSTHVSP
jgi:hypothetical protein